MTRGTLITLAAIFLTFASQACLAADEIGHHLPHNHVALFAGAAFEEQDNGHRETGNVLGLVYVRQVTEHWGWGVALEREVFGESKACVIVEPGDAKSLAQAMGQMLNDPADSYNERRKAAYEMFGQLSSSDRVANNLNSILAHRKLPTSQVTQ